MSGAVAAVPHTNDTAGAHRIAEAFARARAKGRAALIPYIVAGYPDAEVRAQDAWGARLRTAPAFRADSLETWLVRGTLRADYRAIRVPTLAIYGVPRTVEEKYPWVVHASAALRREAELRFAVEAPLLARQRERFRREVPGARVGEIAGGRHYVYLTHPREVAAAIRKFAR